MTNNEVEYEALLYGLELALKLGVQNLKVYLDLELASGHVNEVFEMKDKRMKTYCKNVTELKKSFWRIEIQAIKRELNTRANGITKGASYGEYEKKKRLTTLDGCLKDINMVDSEERIEYEVPGDSWMNPIIDYLRNSKMLEDKNQARKLRLRADMNTLLDGMLFRK